MAELGHFSPLAGVELAAAGADENFERVIDFGHRDRMALVVEVKDSALNPDVCRRKVESAHEKAV